MLLEGVGSGEERRLVSNTDRRSEERRRDDVTRRVFNKFKLFNKRKNTGRRFMVHDRRCGLDRRKVTIPPGIRGAKLVDVDI